MTGNPSMEVISFIILILLSLFGYATGAVGRAGKSVELKPKIIDLVMILVIWAAAIYSRIVLDFNEWLIILAWVVLSILVGILSVWPRKLAKEKARSEERSSETAKNPVRKLWQAWGNFSRRIGNFQSRIILSLFFFTVVFPFALAVKMFSDPLRLRYRTKESHWLPKMKTEIDLEKFRSQF